MSKNRNPGSLGIYASDYALHQDDSRLGKGVEDNMHDGNPAFHDAETLHDESGGTYDYVTGRIRPDGDGERILSMHGLAIVPDDLVLRRHPQIPAGKGDPADEWMKEKKYSWDPPEAKG